MKALGDLKKYKAFLLTLLVCLIFSTALAQKKS